MHIPKHLLWVDALKTVGIIAVILGHIASPLGAFIFSWHMPLFFILAGFFINLNLSAKEFFLKDFKRLMIPYFIFSLIGLAVESLKRFVLHRDGMDYFYELKSIFFTMDMESLMHHYGFVLWFLPALFTGRLAFYIVMKSYFKLAQQMIFLNLWAYSFVFIAVIFYCSFFMELPFAIDKGLNALFWIFIGFAFFQNRENKILYIFPVIGVVICFMYGIPTMDMATKTYGRVVNNIFWAIAIISLSSFVLQRIFSKQYASDTFIERIILMWGGGTMILFILHPYTNNIAYIVDEKFFAGQWYVKFLISLVLLQLILLVKAKFNDKVTRNK